jgi:aldehyde dehydrogenase
VTSRLNDPVRAAFAMAPTSTDTADVRNPADVRQVVGTFPVIGVDYAEAVVERAELSRRGWSAMSAVQRYAQLAGAVGDLQLDGLDRLLVREQGKVLAEAALEMNYCGRVLAAFEPDIGWLDDPVRLPRSGPARTLVFHEPIGTVAILTPWNWPYALAVISVLPALLTGNPVVLFVAPTAPLAALAAFNQLAARLPEGVFSVLTATGIDVPRCIVEHPAVRMVSFTGSTQTGRTVMAEAAPTVTNLTLELGGNDAAILLDDAAIDDATLTKLALGAFTTSGQVCMAIKRLYVPEHALGEVIDGLGAVLDEWVVGDGLDPSTTIGPVHSAPQLRRVLTMVEEASAVGAQVRKHGRLTGDPEFGFFMQPTLVTDVDPRCSLVADEQFGPVLPVLPYCSVDEAIAMANDTDFGLCSSVWSTDEVRALSVARRLEAGTTFINAHGTAAMDPSAPYGGVKHSGAGRRGGRWALEGFTEPHSIVFPQPNAER